MFCIKDGKLYIAKPDLPYSHLVWFKKKAWVKEKSDPIAMKIIRGYVDSKGDVHFYRGNFEVDEKTEREFFKFLPELVKKLKLNPEAKVFGGAIVQKTGVEWPPRKKYGKIKRLVKFKSI